MCINLFIFNVYCNVEDLTNSEIYETWADCNNDGQWDYVFKQKNKTNTTEYISSSDDYFTCVYDEADNYSVTVGCVTQRKDTGKDWDKNLCSKIKEEDSYCNLAKNYVIEVKNALFK